MLLRFVALHGVPVTEEDWLLFKAWKQAQLLAAPCETPNPEVSGVRCKDCHLPVEHCPKKR